MSKPASSAPAPSSSSSASLSASPSPPLPTPWALIARKGAEAGRLEAERKANLRPAFNAHRHAIECVLAFMSLAELAKAVRVCPAWRNAAHHMRPIAATIKLPSAVAQSQRKSELLRHVTVVSCTSFTPSSTPRPAQLAHLFAAMPQLRSIACQVNVPCELFTWPAKLTELTLHLDSSDEWEGTLRALRANELLASLAQGSPALQLLSIRAAVPSLCGLDFEFLVALRQLRILDLDFRWRHETRWKLEDAQTRTLRRLTQITSLEFPRLRAPTLRALLQPPHQFRLAQAPRFSRVDARAGECLASLPTLVRLDARLCSSAAFLSKLPLLTTLDFDCHRPSQRGPAWFLSAEAVVEGLSPCKALTSLTLIAPLQSSHMVALLPRLPLLRSVSLGGMSELDSLRCFSTGPVTSRLTSLTLRVCKHADLDLNELGHLYQLRELETLSVFDAFNEPLTDDDQANYTPPSRIFPRLTQFNYYRSEGYETPEESDVDEDDSDDEDQ